VTTVIIVIRTGDYKSFIAVSNFKVNQEKITKVLIPVVHLLHT